MGSPLEKQLGYVFRNKNLLTTALTHPSTKQGEDNQRMEFLGDAVLEYCISHMLYEKYPDMREGELTERRSALVCEETLSFLAQRLNIGGALRMGHGEEQALGRGKHSILADSFEAMLAAVRLDGGIEAAQSVILRLYQDEELLFALRGRDEKGLLQEYTQARNMSLPEYTVVEETGPAHARHFVVQVSVLGRLLATGQGCSKKAAEQAAAKAALAVCSAP
ncbi:MAG: ribonuclease III [Clostridia bacterium]|nr:ribonuclease III [Clostridia bacterium]